MQTDRSRPELRLEVLEHRVLLSVPSVTHTAANLSFSRYQIAAVTVGTKTFFAGGIDPSIEASSVVDVYDANTGQWSAITAPRPLIGSAFAVDGRLVLTGIDNSGNTPGTATSHLVEIYNPASATWKLKPVPDGVPIQAGRFLIYESARPTNRFTVVYDALRGQSLSKTASVRYGAGMPLDADRAAFQSSASKNAVAVFDAHRRRFSQFRMPATTPANLIGTVNGKLVLASGSLAGPTSADRVVSDLAIFDPTARVLTHGALSQPRFEFDTVTVGPKVFFIGGTYLDQNGAAHQSTVVDVYDDVTGMWSFTTCPPRQFGPPVARVGTKLIFGGSNPSDVYDTAADLWSTVPFSLARSQMASASNGATGIFAGGVGPTTVPAIFPSSNVDLYTDTTPAPILSGQVTGRAGRKTTVTVANTGDASLPAGSTVTVYASPDRTLSGAVSLGQTTLTDTLAAGASVQVKVKISIPATLAPGSYHLLAAVDDHSGSAPTPIAAQSQTFTVRSHSAHTAVSRFRGLFAR